MKHLRIFETEAEYSIEIPDLYLPSVCLVEETKEVYFHPDHMVINTTLYTNERTEQNNNSINLQRAGGKVDGTTLILN